jgi:hypothetical protein
MFRNLQMYLRVTLRISAPAEAAFGEDLKPVADADDESALVRELLHGLHHG